MKVTTTRSRTAAAGPRFFLLMALLAIAVSIAGFTLTYFRPLMSGKFDGPVALHWHGAATFGWILLFALQASLVQARRVDVHRMLGIAGAILAAAMIVTTIRAGLYAVDRDVAAGGGATAVSTLTGVVTSMVLFAALVAAALHFRRRPETHKRLLLLATLVALWPAWFRFRHYFPAVPNPEIWFALVAADAMIVLAAIRDRVVLGRVHPVYAWVGSAIIVEHVIEVLLFDSESWRAAARWLYVALS